VKAIGEQRDEIAEHVPRAWEAVQQQQRRRIRTPCFAIEDFPSVDVGGAIGDGRHGILLEL
jgi:hypothetical protein